MRSGPPPAATGQAAKDTYGVPHRSNFDRDLELGQFAEQAVRRLIAARRGGRCVQAQGCCPAFDLLVDGVPVEVKLDLRAFDRAAIEVGRVGGEPSGLRATAAAWWVHIVLPGIAYFIETDILRKLVKDRRATPGGDGRRSMLVYVSLPELRSKSAAVLPLLEEDRPRLAERVRASGRRP